MDSVGMLQLVVKAAITAGLALGHVTKIIISIGYHLGGAVVQYIYAAVFLLLDPLAVLTLCSLTMLLFLS